MSDPPSPRSPTVTAAWICGVVAGVLLLYLLSYAPVAAANSRVMFQLFSQAIERPLDAPAEERLRQCARRGKVIRSFYAPIIWLSSRSSIFKQAHTWYGEQWLPPSQYQLKPPPSRALVRPLPRPRRENLQRSIHPASRTPPPRGDEDTIRK